MGCSTVADARRHRVLLAAQLVSVSGVRESKITDVKKGGGGASKKETEKKRVSWWGHECLSVRS